MKLGDVLEKGRVEEEYFDLADSYNSVRVRPEEEYVDLADPQYSVVVGSEEDDPEEDDLEYCPEDDSPGEEEFECGGYEYDTEHEPSIFDGHCDSCMFVENGCAFSKDD